MNVLTPCGLEGRLARPTRRRTSCGCGRNLSTANQGVVFHHPLRSDEQRRRGLVLRPCRGLAFCAGTGPPGAAWLRRRGIVGRGIPVPVPHFPPARLARGGPAGQNGSGSLSDGVESPSRQPAKSPGSGTARCGWPLSWPLRRLPGGRFPAACGTRCPCLRCWSGGRHSESGVVSGRRLNCSRRSMSSTGQAITKQ